MMFTYLNSNAFRMFGTKVVAVPAMGDSISSGVVEEFVKGPGEFVEADEIIARIETDKVTVDITAPESGVILEYMADEGDSVDVGADFYKLDTDGKAGAGGAAAAASPPPPPKAEPAPAAAAPTPPPKPAAAPPPPSAAAPAKAPSMGKAA